MTSKLPNGFIYTECTKDTKYGYHNPQAHTRASTSHPEQHTAKKTYTSQCDVANDGTRLPCGHVVSSPQAPNQASRSAYPGEQPRGYAQQGVFPSGGQGMKKTKCQCPLYTYKRYDKIEAVKADPPHYPSNLKTVYTKDYPPKEAEHNKMSFAPMRTVQKSYPTKDNYTTIARGDYTPKKARSTTPIKQPEHKYTADVPFRGKTEYDDMTKTAFEHVEYHPVKRPVEPFHMKHGFPETTEYNHEYTPKRAPKTSSDLKLADAIFRDSTPQKNAAPLEDKTIYRGDYTPKRTSGPRVTVMKAHDANPMPRAKLFDGLTMYKKDYLNPEIYQCECPEYEAAHFPEHTHAHAPNHTVPATEGHHHIHEVPAHQHSQQRVTEHVHESGPSYRYEQVDHSQKSPLKIASQRLPNDSKMDRSGRYFDRVDRTSSKGNNYVERNSGPVRGSGGKHGDHLHYIETMCEDHGGNHRHYIETLCPDHHHIHTLDQ